MSTEIKVTFEERARRAALARAGRNRNVGMGHPTTSEIEYTPAEMEFMGAVQAWKNRTARQFPTWREVLGIIRSLGYER